MLGGEVGGGGQANITCITWLFCLKFIEQFPRKGKIVTLREKFGI